MAKSTSRLGKGLGALIPSRDPGTNPTLSPLPATAPDRNQIRHIAIDSIAANRHQPRTTFDDVGLAALAESVRSKGILQPIVVRSTGDHAYELVAGERRWRAARIAGLPTVPAIVREFTDAESFEAALVENLQREDLAPLERAAAYQHYLEAFGGTIEDFSQRLGESRANISNYLRLLKLRPEICFMLGSGELGMGHARAIAGITDPQRQLSIARLAARRNLSVRQVEELAREAESTAQRASKDAKIAPDDGQRQHLAEVEQSLTKAIGLRVRLRAARRKNAGRIIISYASLDEFDRIVERLGGQYAVGVTHVSVIRPAVFAGRFYPGTRDRCQRTAAELTPKIAAPAAFGAIVPHAGWIYSGSTAALSISGVAASKPETVVIFGAVHGPDSNPASVFTSGAWATPLGDVQIDEELARRFTGDRRLVDAPAAHRHEHSIEVQLPLIQQVLPDVMIVPIGVRPGSDAADIGQFCAAQAKDAGRRVTFVGSTDLTHYGPAFGFEPHGHGPDGIRWAKDVNDRRFIALIQALQAEAVVPEALSARNACGPGAVAATIGAVRELGAMCYQELRHTCSAETEGLEDRDRFNSVGYEAGVFVQAG